jgi:TM2 domain-containing membrane protein YozV
MRAIKLSYLGFLMLSLFLNSCTIEKRVHRPGYFIEWHVFNKNITETHQPKEKKQRKTQDQQAAAINEIKEYVVINETPSGTETNINKQKTNVTSPIALNAQIEKSKSQKRFLVSEEECDIIYFKNGKEVLGKVLEIGETHIKYKACENLDGPVIVLSKSEIYLIKYPNGSATSIVTEEKKPDSNINNNNSNNINIQNKVNVSRTSDDRSIFVAVVLWFFLGLLGVHRFYLGHNGMGILYLFTGALCGLGWIIDGLLFLTGGLQPKNGKYID